MKNILTCFSLILVLFVSACDPSLGEKKQNNNTDKTDKSAEVSNAEAISNGGKPHALVTPARPNIQINAPAPGVAPVSITNTDENLEYRIHPPVAGITLIGDVIDADRSASNVILQVRTKETATHQASTWVSSAAFDITISP